MAPSSTQRSSGRRGATSDSASARYATFILYLLLAAALFGGVLLHRITWAIRCQDAIDMSHTASAFAKTYAGTDVTRTVEFKTAFNTTLLRVLDDKLPALISQTCNSLELFNFRPVLPCAYIAFAACYGISIAVFYTSATGANADGESVQCYVRTSIASGFATGCRFATAAWIVLLQFFTWTSVFDSFDSFDLLSLEGLFFSLIPAIGALTSIACDVEVQIVQKVPIDEEMGLVEER